jgi:hypothetical protein
MVDYSNVLDLAAKFAPLAKAGASAMAKMTKDSTTHVQNPPGSSQRPGCAKRKESSRHGWSQL